MTIFCDRLTCRVAFVLVWRRLTGTYPARTAVGVMDGPVTGPVTIAAAAALGLAGFTVSEVPFFAGHLKAASGESVGAVAAKEGTRLADLGGNLIIARSQVLGALNERWQRDTLRLRTAKQLWLPAMGLMLRVLAAEALARAAGRPAVLMVRWPAALPRELVRDLRTAIPVEAHGTRRAGWKAGRVSPLLWWLRGWLRSRRASPGADLSRTGPGRALLVLQEDDLTADRSYRSQPHWLHGDAPPFRTIVLQTSKTLDVDLPFGARAAAGIEVVSLPQLAAIQTDSPVARRLRRDLIRLSAFALLTPDPAVALAQAEAARLAMAAAELAHLVQARRIGTFLTCENYMLHADAMQLIAGPLGVRTLSYQYTNLPTSSLLLATTSDRVLTFAPLFHGRFSRPGFRRPDTVDTGYVFASSFALTRPRGLALRGRLEASGARFVVGVFDESVQRDKYGWVGLQDYEEDLRFFLDKVRQDPSLGLVLKPQFQHNLAGLSPALVAALDAAVATGRVEMPSHGRHRNTVFPSEVAAASDIVVGHALGGTANLEAALAGCRSIMVNSYSFVGETDDLYAGAQIMFPSLEEAWTAIVGYRRGDAERRALGDWTPILGEFDAFGDGGSAGRFRSVLEEEVCR